MKTLERMDNNASSMMHSALVYQIKKSRGINWTPSEKRVGVIEDKKSDLVTLSKKAAAWKFIHSKFSARFGRKRTPIRIKEQWKRMKIAARAELRDRGVQPEVGVAPVDPNTVTNKYYGESLDIISKVQQILFGKEQPSISLEDTGDGNSFEIPFEIKTEPMDDHETAEMLSDYSDSHGNESFRSDSSLVQEDGQMYLCNNQYKDSRFNLHSQPPNIMDNNQFVIQNSIITPCTTSTPVMQKVNTIHERHVISSTIKDHPVKHPVNRVLTSQESSRNGPNIKHNEPTPPRTSSHIAISKTVEDKLLEYARIEHARKMEIMEDEHNLQVEILTMQRNVAAAKLKKANLKLNALNVEFP